MAAFYKAKSDRLEQVTRTLATENDKLQKENKSLALDKRILQIEIAHYKTAESKLNFKAGTNEKEIQHTMSGYKVVR